MHSERMKLEINLHKGNAVELKRQIYSHLADLGIGRTAIIYAKKKKL